VARRLHPIIGVLAILTMAFLYLPMLAVAAFSVNASRYGLVWRGFTLKWYAGLLENQYVLEAARNTLILAVVSTLIATVLGTLLAIGMSRYPWPAWARRYLDLSIYLPVVTPDIIFAAAMVVAFGLLRAVWSIFNPGLLTMIVAHVTFQIAFVALVVQSRLATIGRTLEEAARDLYADTWILLRRVILPLLMPGIVAGAMLAFTLSLDDFVISFFTAGPDSTTLPIFIFASVRRGVTPEIHALSTLIFLLTVLLVIGIERMTRYRTA
jgi:spermidine/putrescine transport system permease protein